MLAAILATALAATGTSDWPQRINLEPSHGLLADNGSPRDDRLVPRIGAEAVLGTLTGAIFGLGGAGTAALFFPGGIETLGARLLVGGSIGVSMGVLLGIYAGALALGGDGSIQWALAGDVAGLVVALLAYSVTGVVGLVLLPVLGAIIAYELSEPVSPAVEDPFDAAAATSLFAPVVARF